MWHLLWYNFMDNKHPISTGAGEANKERHTQSLALGHWQIPEIQAPLGLRSVSPQQCLGKFGPIRSAHGSQLARKVVLSISTNGHIQIHSKLIESFQSGRFFWPVLWQLYSSGCVPFTSRFGLRSQNPIRYTTYAWTPVFERWKNCVLRRAATVSN